MRAYGLLSLTLPADNPDLVRRWWAETLELPPSEETPEALDLGEVELRFSASPVVRVVAGEGPVELVDPAGTRVEVVPPDTAAAERAHETIQAFVTEADALPGRPVGELVDEVAGLVREVRDQVAALLVGVPHNKVLAAQLAFGQRAREAMPSDDQWYLHAASALMSGFIIAGAN